MGDYVKFTLRVPYPGSGNLGTIFEILEFRTYPSSGSVAVGTDHITFLHFCDEGGKTSFGYAEGDTKKLLAANVVEVHNVVGKRLPTVHTGSRLEAPYEILVTFCYIGSISFAYV